MATRAVERASTLQADTLPDFVLIRTDEVDAGERMRAVDPVWAEALGQIMLREGQRTPIEVCRLPGSTRWTLVSGGHRHAGALAAGIEHLRAEIVSAARDDRRMREVSENLWRRDLDPVDRAAFVAEAVALHKRRAGIDPSADGRAISAAVRWQKAVEQEAADANVTMTFAYGFSETVADELGLSSSSVARDLMLYRRLQPSVVELLRKHRHPVATNATQLRALAKLEAVEQLGVAEYLVWPGKSLGNPVPRTVAEAIAYERNGPARAKKVTDPEAKRLSAFTGNFARMGVAEKKGALQHLLPLLPAGTTLTNMEQKPSGPAFPAQHAEYRDDVLAAIDAIRELIDGIEEDELLPVDRMRELRRADARLQMARLTVAGNGFQLGGDA